MGCPARFNDTGNFYCPYCLYKKAVAESYQARTDAMEKKKALLIFIDEEETNEKKSEGKGPNRQSNDGVVNVGESSLDRSFPSAGEHMVSNKEEGKNKVQDDDSDPSFKMCEEESKEETIQEDDSKDETEDDSEASSSESKDQDPSFHLHDELKDSDTKEDVIEDEDGDSETYSNSSREEHSVHVRLRATRGSRSTHLSEDEYNDAVPVDTKRINKNKQRCEETFHIPRRSFRRRSSSSDEDADDSRIFEQPHHQPSVKWGRLTFQNAKRNRLMWSQEEVETLEKGVLKYSELDKNIPWRKILEYGRKVFHITRTPADLKDKWRKMVTR